MNIFITFQELQPLIQRKTRKAIELKTIDAKTIAAKICLTKNVLGISVPLNMKMQIQIIGIEKNVITVAFLKKGLRDKLVEIVLPYIPDIQNLPFLRFDEKENTVSINLNRIEKAQKALEYIDLRDIRFEQDGISAKAELKNVNNTIIMTNRYGNF